MCQNNFYLGPYALIDYKKLPLEYIPYNGCPICNIKMDSKYCPNCGQKCKTIKKQLGVAFENIFWGLQIVEEYPDGIIIFCINDDYNKDSKTHINLNFQKPEIMEKDIKMFKSKQNKDIKMFIEHYGDQAISYEWGIVEYSDPEN
jgi:hypothetical protein